jgi:UDP-N-acetylmuramate--alanine ligase
MDCYRDMTDVETAFVEFMDRVPFYGASVACVDNPLLRVVLPRVRRRLFTYGESADADFRVRILERNGEGLVRFEVNYGGVAMGPFTLHVPGRHNVLNAAAAVAIGVQLGVAPEQIAAGLDGFRGVDRRFQVKGTARGVTVVDDYGHHPTEIVATLQAAKDCGYGRVLVLFQPHRYTRTRDLMDEFIASFGDADRVEVLDIYAASEEPIAGITAKRLVESIGRAEVKYAASVEQGIEALVREAREGDVILTLGAGNVSQAAGMILERLGAAEPVAS